MATLSPTLVVMTCVTPLRAAMADRIADEFAARDRAELVEREAKFTAMQKLAQPKS